MIKKLKWFPISICLLILSIILVITITPNIKKYGNSGKLIINEIMAKNMNTLTDNYHQTSDWIELYNGYDFDINLEGYYLSDKEYETSKWTFPSVTIKANDYLIVYASGIDSCDLINNICHTNFKLSSLGEIVTLTDRAHNIVSKITYNEMGNDISYGFNGINYVYYEEGTPNKKNGNNYINDISKYLLGGSTLEITEYMTNNQSFKSSSKGYYHDWVELHNYGNKTINLEGINVSDNLNNLEKYTLPSIDVPSDGYIIIYFSGTTEKYSINNEIHLPFKLKGGEIVSISYNNKIIDKIEVKDLKTNVSYGKYLDEWYYYTYPTPLSKNNTKGHITLGGIS